MGKKPFKTLVYHQLLLAAWTPLAFLIGFQGRNYICPSAVNVSSTKSWVSERNVFFASLCRLICSQWAQSNSLPPSQSTVNWKLHWVTEIRSHSLTGICVRLVYVCFSERSLEVCLRNLGDSMVCWLLMLWFSVTGHSLFHANIFKVYANVGTCPRTGPACLWVGNQNSWIRMRVV